MKDLFFTLFDPPVLKRRRSDNGLCRLRRRRGLEVAAVVAAVADAAHVVVWVGRGRAVGQRRRRVRVSGVRISLGSRGHWIARLRHSWPGGRGGGGGGDGAVEVAVAVAVDGAVGAVVRRRH